MIRNADITIYNYHYDPATKEDKWFRTQIRRIEWHGGQKVSVSDSGFVSADSYTVRIPLDQTGGFLLPEDYKGEHGTWTAKEGDIVVRGLLDTDITKASELNEISQRFVMIGWSDNRRGSPRVQHIRIEGK